jgi:hypothetical protein
LSPALTSSFVKEIAPLVVLSRCFFRSWRFSLLLSFETRVPRDIMFVLYRIDLAAEDSELVFMSYFLGVFSDGSRGIRASKLFLGRRTAHHAKIKHKLMRTLVITFYRRISNINSTMLTISNTTANTKYTITAHRK